GRTKPTAGMIATAKNALKNAQERRAEEVTDNRPHSRTGGPSIASLPNCLSAGDDALHEDHASLWLEESNVNPSAPGSCSKAGFGRRFAAYRVGEEAMFSHVMIGTNDVAASKKFYDAVLGAIGVASGSADPKGRIFYRTKTGVFAISKPIDGEAATHANGGTIGFACDSPEKVRAFHEAGVANGGQEHRGSAGLARGYFRQALSGLHTGPSC